MTATTTTTFTDADGNKLDIDSEEGGGVSFYAHDAFLAFQPSDVPALLAAIQHAAAMSAASTTGDAQ